MFTIETGEVKPFEFSVDGKEYSVPMFGDLGYQTMREFVTFSKDAAGTDVIWWFIENVFEKYAPGCSENLTANNVAQLVEAYSEASNLGE